MRYLHTSITVRDLDASIGFYTRLLGLEFVRRRSIPENHAEVAFLREPLSGAHLELTHWDGKDVVDPGEQLDHLAFEVPDLDPILADARTQGVRIAKEPFRLSGGGHRIAFLLDPNDVWIELIERPRAEP